MIKTLKVVEPFGSLSVGDVFELNEKSGNYEYSHNNVFTKLNKDGENYSSSIKVAIDFSPAFAKGLIDAGYLASVDTDKQGFVNVFDEIDRLLYKYTEELKSVDTAMVNHPECVKLERTTVLNNLITLLTHLKNLKK